MKIKALRIAREMQIVNTKIGEAEEENDERAMQHFLTCKQQLLEQKKACAAHQVSFHLH